MKTKTPTPVSLVRLARKRARDHAIHDAQEMANHTTLVQFVYEVPALAPSLSPFVYMPSGAIKPVNGKLILTVRPA